MTPRGALRLVVCGAMLGCTPEFVAPEPPAAGQALATMFRMSFFPRQQSGDSLFFSAHLLPAADSGGALVSVVNDTLLVNGVPFAPDSPYTVAPFRYVYAPALVENAAGTIVQVRVPVVDGVRNPPGTVMIPVVTRTGPSEMEIARGDDLLLPVVAGNIVPDLNLVSGPRSYLSIAAPGTRGIDIVVEGPMPSPWRVPGEWLAGIEGDTALVRLQVSVFLANLDSEAWYSASVDTYLVSFDIRTMITWTVTLR